MYGRPTQAATLQPQSLIGSLRPDNPQTQTLFQAVVIDSFAYVHAYLVQADQEAAVIASAITPGTLSAMGYRHSSYYTPGTKVLCYRTLTGGQTFILGQLSLQIDSAAGNMADWVLQASRCSFQEELPHNLPRNMQPAGFLPNFNHGRPVDSYNGELAWMNSLGMGLHLGAQAMFMRASEINGIWMFYQDDLLRIAGHNYQLWTAGREETSGNDEGEINDIVRVAAFYNEAIGTAQLQATIHKEKDPKWDADNAEARYEPVVTDQMGIFRLQQFRGFLGDGGEKVITSAPPQTLEVERLSLDTMHLGLSETQRHANGTLSFRSAKAIIWEKTPLIPVPKQKKAPDDPEGDQRQDEGYRFAGLSPDEAPEHDKSEFTWTSPEDPLARPIQLRDMHAWLFNSYAQEGFHRHSKDWFLPQEGSYAQQKGLKAETPATSMGMTHRKAMPPKTSLWIDHRKNHSHDYYHSRSIRAMLDDGTIHDQDGYGSSITMSGGNIIITCPGDIEFRSGRNTVVHSGRDAIVKAGNCLDLSAAKGDLRVKADKNLELLGGSSGTGGVLIESKGTGTPDMEKPGTDAQVAGIMLKSGAGPLWAVGGEVYIRSTEGRAMTLDASGGSAELRATCSRHVETVASEYRIIYGIAAESQSEQLTYESHTASSIVFGQAGQVIFAANHLAIPAGSLLVDGVARIRNGVVWSGSPAPMNGPWRTADHDLVRQTARTIQDQYQSSREVLQALRTLTYREGRLGHERLRQVTEFTFRTDEQYGIDDLVVYEASWQHDLDAGVTYEEPPVEGFGGRKTRPFPGNDRWETQELYRTYEDAYWQKATGINADRPYEAPTGGALTSAKLSTSYKVTIQS